MIVLAFCLSILAPSVASAATLLSDSFSGTTIDTGTWAIKDTAGTNITQSNALYVKGSYSNPNWDQTSISTVSTYATSSLSISVKVTRGSGSSGDTLIGYGDPNFQVSGAKAYIIDLTGSGHVYGLVWNNQSTSGSNLSTCGAPTDGATYTLSVTSTGFDIYKDTGSGSTKLCSITTSVVPTNGTIFFESDSSSVGGKYENLVVTGTGVATVPDAPTSLVATPGNAEMALAWTSPAYNGGASITDYQVDYKLHADSTWTTFSDGVSTATSTTVTGLANDSSYDFRVSAVNSQGTSTPSSTVTATPAPSAPGAPTDVTATATSSAAILSWTSGNDGGSSITDYIVQYKLSATSTWSTFADGTSTATSTTITGLTNGLSYDFRVAAVNAIGTSTYSSTVSTTPVAISSGSGVLLSDSFTGTSIDTGTWTIFDTTGTKIAQDGTLTIKGSYVGSSWYQTALTSVDEFPRTNLTLSAKMTEGDSGSAATLMGYGDPNFQASGNAAYIIDLVAGSLYALAWNDGTYTSNLSCGTYSAGAIYKLEITDTGFSIYKNTGSSDVLQCAFATSLNLTNKHFFLESAANTSGGVFDDALVTNTTISAPDAPTALAATEGSGQVALTWTPPANDGGASITDYKVEYKLSADSSWKTFYDATSTATSSTVTGLTNGSPYDFRVSAVNSAGTGTASATTSATPNDANAAVNITFPLRSESASSTTATLTIHDEDSHDFTIPYIQTSPDLTVSASVGTALVPAGGGLKFILNEGKPDETSLTDTDSPYSVTFAGLAKGDYTLDVYVVDSHGAIQSGSNYHDSAIHIGIGDIISAVGDSITECYYGLRTTTAVTSWLNAPSNMISSDNRNFPQYGPTTAANLGTSNWCAAWEVQLADELESYYGYPVFIMNEGVGGIRADNTVTRMNTSQWSDREAALKPNKMLLHLGTNDGIANITTSNFQASMQTIIDTFLTTYHVSASDIWLAYPSYSATYTKTANYLPNITALIDANGISIGPDFWDFYSHDTTTYYGGDPVHPNTTGETQMARLWALSMMSPASVQATQSGNSIHLSWQGIDVASTSVAGYIVHYGTSATALTSELDAGSSTSATLSSGLSDGTTYYFGIQAYDGGYSVKSYSATSTVQSLAFATDSAAPAISSVVLESTGSTETISWHTNESADSQVEYGLGANYTASTTLDNSLVLNHAQTITGLAACASYHYRILSADAASNLGSTTDAVFTTSGCTGSSSVATTTAGSVNNSAGGSLSLTGTDNTALRLIIPSGFATSSSAATFEANQLDKNEFYAAAGKPSGMTGLGAVFSLKAQLDLSNLLHAFASPLTITLSYDPSALNGIDPQRLAIYRYDSGAGWTALTGCTVDASAHTVECQTSNFSDFALFGPTPATSSASYSTAPPPGSIVYGCKDPAASNYNAFSSSKPSLCTYASTSFTRDLTLGTRGEDVTTLQRILIAQGYLATGNDIGTFGPLTKAALAAYQKAKGIQPAVGYFGTLTRTSLAASTSSTTTSAYGGYDVASMTTSQILALIATLTAEVKMLEAKLATH